MGGKTSRRHTKHVSLQHGGKLSLTKGLLNASEAEMLFKHLSKDLPWQRSQITVFGKKHLIPRLNAWIGDPKSIMIYSKTTFTPEPWTRPLHDLNQKLSLACNVKFNSVLANLYRDGNDSMGWHADDEKELGKNPVIASLSLGAPRDFILRHKTTSEKHTITLEHGDLLVMSGTTQHHYKHALPKRLRSMKPRINLTFRRIMTSKDYS